MNEDRPYGHELRLDLGDRLVADKESLAAIGARRSPAVALVDPVTDWNRVIKVLDALRTDEADSL